MVVLHNVSGSYLNSAGTVGLMKVRQFALRAGLLYIVAQIIGTFLVFVFGSPVRRQLPTTELHANAL